MPETPPEKRPLGIAVWGIGAHAVRSVLPAIAASPDVELVGIHSRDPQAMAAQAGIYGCQVWRDLADMLASPQVEVVYLATPTALHFDQGRQVLAEGKHLWCEKPLTTDLAEAEALIDLAKARDLSLAVVCGPRYHPHYLAVREQMDQGHLGQVLRIRAAFRFPHLAPENFRYNPDLGGGALLDLGFYLLGVVDALAPARFSTLCGQLAAEAGYGVDTSGRASATCADGCEVELEWGYGFDYENSLSITGTGGQLTTAPFFSKPQNLAPRLAVTTRAGRRRLVEIAPANQFVCMFAEFGKAIHDRQLRQHLLQDAHRYQQLLHLTGISAQQKAGPVAVT